MNTKTVIVTGASQGIGAGLVKAFRGYNVVANSRNITKSGAFEASTRANFEISLPRQSFGVSPCCKRTIAGCA
jgi:NAD(P)-dependent dehydrogenase (short-subunit alcohol dehydrogenase family)